MDGVAPVVENPPESCDHSRGNSRSGRRKSPRRGPQEPHSRTLERGFIEDENSALESSRHSPSRDPFGLFQMKFPKNAAEAGLNEMKLMHSRQACPPCRRRHAAASGCRFWLPLLVAASGCRFWLPLLVAASGCRFWLPLPVAASGCRLAPVNFFMVKKRWIRADRAGISPARRQSRSLKNK
jgi:hypothetical protein